TPGRLTVPAVGLAAAPPPPRRSWDRPGYSGSIPGATAGSVQLDPFSRSAVQRSAVQAERHQQVAVVGAGVRPWLAGQQGWLARPGERNPRGSAVDRGQPVKQVVGVARDRQVVAAEPCLDALVSLCLVARSRLKGELALTEAELDCRVALGD